MTPDDPMGSSTGAGAGTDAGAADDAGTAAVDLRRRTQAALKSRFSAAPASPADSARLLHELQVHQIELELQNEELVARCVEVEAGLARYTDLYDFAPVAYTTLAADSKITQTNLAGARLLGHLRADLVGRRLLTFIVEADRRAFSAWLQGVLDSGSLQRCQLRLGPPGSAAGTVRTVQIDAERAPEGKLCRATLVDLTERLAADDALRLLEASVAQLNDAVLITEAAPLSAPGPRIVFVNAACERLAGYSRTELIGASPRLLQGPRTDRAELDRIRSALQMCAPVHAELINYRKDGAAYWVEINLAPVYSAAGSVTHFVAIERDITQLKQAALREATHSSTMRALADGAPMAEVLATLVRGVEAEHPAALGSVLLLDAAGTHLLTGAAPNLPASYNQAIHGVAIGPAVGSCGTAAFTGQRVVVADIGTDARWADYKTLAAQAGLAACWSEPIRGASGRLLGTFAIYHAVPCTPGEAEIASIVATGQLAAVAIERTQADEALRTSKQLLEATQSIAQVGGWELDLASGQLLWTAEAYRIHDTSPAQFNPTMDAAIAGYLPSSRPLISQALRSAMERGEGYDLVLEKLTAKGRRIDVRTICTVTLHEGRPVKLIGIFQDITQQKAAQAALVRSEKYFSEVINNAGNPIFVKDDQSRLLLVNDAGCAIFGLPRAQIIGKTLAENVPPDQLEHFMRIDRQVLTDGVENVCEETLTISGRAPLTVVTKKTRYIDEAGKHHLIGMIQDITQRKQAEQAQRDNEGRLAGLVDSAMDAIISVDAQQRIVLYNAAAERMFGYTAASVMGQSLDRMLPLSKRARHTQQIAGFASTDTTARHMSLLRPLKALRANGEEFPIEASISRVTVSGQTLFTVIMRDMTEPQRAARQVLDFQESLRALLRRLQQAQEEERTRMAREIHDELGQLLTGLKMDLRWLERKLSEPGLPPALNALLDRTVAASALNDQTMATVQKLAVELRPAALDQLGLAAALAQRVRQFQQRTGVACTLQADEWLQTLPPAVASDLYYICQEALTNVTRHAQATQVAVRLRSADGGVQLQIEDNGVGIDPAAPAAPRSLGLLGMQERARSCGGSMSLAAVAPHGTCVTVWVPGLAAAR